MTLQDSITKLDTFTREWETWHRQQEDRLADPHGFLAITNLHWLGDEPQHFSDAPGAWSSRLEGVNVSLGEGEELIVDGTTVAGQYSFGIIPERGSTYTRWGDAQIEVAKRGGYDIVRPRHPNNPLRLAFRGTPAYRPDPRWVVVGRYVAFDEPRPSTVGAAVDGLEHVYDSPGRIEFELDGQSLALTAFPGHEPEHLTVLFADATSGITTYGLVRGLSVDPPTPDGTVVLDFNRAANLPCAYTDLATCPLPPAENRLPVSIQAGEKIPYERL